MRTRSVVALVVAVLVCGCEKARTPEQRAAETTQPVTFVGCVEQGDKPDEFVVKGRSVLGRVVATTGSQPGSVPSTETLPGGDAYRTTTRNGTKEDLAERISPRLVSDTDQNLKAELGHRVVVSGEFLPATHEEPLGELKVRSIERVSDHCEME